MREIIGRLSSRAIWYSALFVSVMTTQAYTQNLVDVEAILNRDTSRFGDSRNSESYSEAALTTSPSRSKLSDSPGQPPANEGVSQWVQVILAGSSLSTSEKTSACRNDSILKKSQTKEIGKHSTNSELDLKPKFHLERTVKPALKPASKLEPELIGRLDVLQSKIEKCLSYYKQTHENAATRSPWGIMHSMIGFGPETEIYANGGKQNALRWLCSNNPCRGTRLFHIANGRIQGKEGPGLQGHSGQFLAMLAQCDVKSTFPMRVGNRNLTVADLVYSEMYSCKTRTELTFKLIGLSHYLPSDARWKSRDGETWTIPRLIKEELAQPIQGAACGGTHRMMGFSYCVRTREQRGEPITGEWHRAKKFVDDYHEFAIGLQNPDGSFSTSFFEGRGNSADIDARIRTTGHILEWLVFSLPEDRLLDGEIMAAVDYLATRMVRHHDVQWEVGPKGHALRALALYNNRVFGVN